MSDILEMLLPPKPKPIRYYLVVDSVGLGDCFVPFDPEFVCSVCLDDDDIRVKRIIDDISCDRCGRHTLPY